MSSCKLWKDRSRSKGLHSENGYTKQRRMPPLLRLDSTGEISSAELANPGQNPKCFKAQHFSSNPGNQMSLKGLFDSLKMSTVLGSAASYLEGFCNNNSRRNLVRSESDTTALQYLHNMWKNQGPVTGKDHSGSFDSVLMQDNTCKSFVDMDRVKTCPADKLQLAKPAPVTVSDSILGVLQNTLSNCNSSVKSKSEPYIPPPLKNRAMESACRNRGAVFDPKLTPYNARLLARSRNQRKYAEDEAQKLCQKVDQPTGYRRSQKCYGLIECEQAVTPEPESNACAKGTLDVENSEGQKITESPSCDNVPDNRLSEAEPSINIINDWFDYENNNFENCPVSDNRTDTVLNFSSKHDILSCENATPCDSPAPVSPSMHSWHCVEFDVDVQKAAEDRVNSSQKVKCKKTANPQSVNIPQELEKRNSVSANYENGNTVPTDVKHPETKTESTCVFPSILYVRKLQQSKKCRPSSKKRRRQKGQPADTINVSKEKKPASATSPPGSVAFILGIDSNNEQNSSHPFLLSCDTDSSSDWSESDLEEDGIVGECMEELCSPFNNPLSLFNLGVMCSIQPTSPAPCSTIDAINLSWQVNISVDSEVKPSGKKKSPAKKVCFAQDKDLETVHPMFAWSYAYAAARKGPWEEIARDRGRFLRRITDGEKLLSPILDTKHREKVFRERFETDSA